MNIEIDNREINLVEILKNFPIGTMLYSTVYGNVIFERIKSHTDYPIRAIAVQGGIITFTRYGRLNAGYGECTLFPSETQRDWNQFEITDTIPIDTPMMVSNDRIRSWELGYYAGNKTVFTFSKKSTSGCITTFKPMYMVPVNLFDFNGTHEGNIKKSVI